MDEELGFDLKEAHNHFSTCCFNRAWELIDQAHRSPAQDYEMIRLSLASTWHWTQREDCTNKNYSIGYWQTSRIYSILGQADNARRYGKLCLDVSQEADVPPFFLGYAYEALARAEAVAGNQAALQQHLQQARETAEKVSDPEEKQLLLDDLEALE